jgi:cytochrome c oxidase assembly protein subunit 15
MLIYLYDTTSSLPAAASDKGILLLTAVSMVVLLAQVFFGTEVRAAVDRVSASLPRFQWIESAGFEFIRHRAFSWTVLVVHVLLVIKLWKTEGLNSLSRYLLVLTLATFLTGAGMAYFSVPAFLQPVHLLLAAITFGIEGLVLFRLIPGKNVQTNQA